ncbi:S-adenosyl-L-methionine-dependent methyltransferase [Mycena capillaripes]|nr:S-adenosyl-L-methionine-dependent methyltransferase [Mycena capillaripes]
MPPPPRRPTAFEVSFPEEAAAAQLAALQIRSQTSSPASSPLKRKATANDSNDTLQRGMKRAQRLPVAYYKPSRGSITVETAQYRAPGEDPDPETKKPTRVLYNFCVFEPAARNELVSLDALEISDNNRQFAAAGIVLLDDEDDEDYGQEDGADATEETEGDYVRLNDVSLYPFDYDADTPVYIETQFAFYELRSASSRYKPYLLEFAAPRRVARRVLMAHPQENLARFRKELTDDDLREAVPYIRQVLEENGDRLIPPLIKAVLALSSDTGPRLRTRPRGQNNPQKPKTLLGNPDLALLKAENQSATHVTPLIAELAKGYFEETLEVIGSPPVPPNKTEIETHKANALRFLKECIARTRSQEKKTIFSSERRQHQQYGRYVEQATIGGESYKSNDFVCIRKGHYRGVPAPLMNDIPDDAQLAEYFWFARIMYFNLDSQKAHVQWLEHGSQIIFGEMAHPQELFLTMLCEDQHVGWIAGKITVIYSNTMEPPRKRDQYFIRSVYDEVDASFTSLDQDEMNRIIRNIPPDNCLPCWRTESYNSNSEWSILKERKTSDLGKGSAGVAYQGHEYHQHEFFLYNAGSGPAHIGYIENIQIHRRGTGMPKIEFTKVGRMRDLMGVPLDEDDRNIYPERHLFLTSETSSILVNELIRPIHVYAWDFFLNPNELKRWVDYSPYHFYCSFRLPSLTELHAESWAQRTVILQTLSICEFCPSEMYRPELEESRFDAEQARDDFHCLDLFGGTGAFSQGLAEGSRGCLKPTHLIEITPSAARTAQKNAKKLVTYCQDANVVLRYFIKSHAKKEIEVPVQLFDNKTPVPPPIEPGKMRAIIAGLPCQSHSGLNMYRKAEDRKSNLMLTAASYVDFFRPDFFFLENVPGFLRYNLLASQVDRHRVEGGIEMGGLKLLVRALQDMNYQVRFSQLQAGNYGTPQNRVRFFLIAARHGLPLPNMPQPTHDFETNQLNMRMPYYHKPQVSPIRTTRGRAPHAGVSIEDAIGDLPPFDWKHPDPKNASISLQNLIKERRRKGIPVYECDREKAHCGFEGAVAYKHEPWTSFQRQARERPTEALQQYTRCLLPKTVERVVTIPLQTGADFRSLPDNLGEWQFDNPTSAVGRNRYRGGLYGRLDNSGCFPTTVTNMHPTAKQSKVLHPSCLRMVSVRELARSQGFPDWFVFVSINDNVVTLHRQIGNAVPWQVSRALGRELRTALFEKWKKKLPAAGEEDVEMV